MNCLQRTCLIISVLPVLAMAQKPRMNVLFIAVDDLRPELGAYGARHIVSPNLDRLAASGTLFERAYCQQAVCSPSRTSMLTGLRPDRTRVYDLETHFRTNVPDVVTLPQHFRQQGYQTTALGKIYHGKLDDTLSWSVPLRRPNIPNHSYQLADNIRLNTLPGKQGRTYEAANAPDSVYEDAQTAQMAINQLRTWKNKPFFLAVGFLKPHLPFVAPKKYWDLYDSTRITLPARQTPPDGAPAYALPWGEIATYHNVPKQKPMPTDEARRLIHGYYACVSFVDVQIGRVLDELRRLGLDKNTIVVLWGDHGWKLGDYGYWCKHTNYELDTRAPLLIRVPGQPTRNRVPALVEFVDVYPTLCAAAGLPTPGHVQGQSLLGFVRGKQKTWDKPALSQYPRQNKMGYALRTDRYRYVRWQNHQNPAQVEAVELYDHQTDPGETRNLATDPTQQAILNELDHQLTTRLK
jgi:iduronate 2-sulfatase